MKKKYMKQLFTPETNTIVTGDIEPAISIDHNQRLIAGIQSLQTVLGVAEMTPMAAGTLVKQYKYTKVNTPDQVAEGETIGLTEYKRTLANTFELILKKFRKQTTAETIQKVGRSKAVDETDTLLLREVQKGVKSDFFTAIGAGTGTATPVAGDTPILQRALAALWGALTVKYADMVVTPVYFVNPLDIADYIAKATVTVQNAFGFSYIENFLGLGMVILDPSVTVKTVEATMKENLNGVYVPAGGDVGAAFGLTADSTGMVGMKHYLADDKACVDTLIMSGVLFYAEDASGIYKASLATA